MYLRVMYNQDYNLQVNVHTVTNAVLATIGAETFTHLYL